MPISFPYSHILLKLGLLAVALSQAAVASTPAERRVTMDVRDMSVQNALRTLFKDSGLNYIIEPGVEGKVTAKVAKLPVKEALGVVLNGTGLTCQSEKGLYIIGKGVRQPKKTPAWVPPAGSGPAVRVGLTSGIGRPSLLVLSCSDAFDVIDSAGGYSFSVDAGRRMSFSLRDGSIDLTLADTPLGNLKGPIRLMPGRETSVFEIITPKTGHKGYRGVLEIMGGGRMTIVNELALEDYTRGVVPMEAPKSFHPEAQKALVIAIRTYALKHLKSGRHKTDGFNLCDSTDCQGYTGIRDDTAWIDKLVDETRGQIAVYKDEPIYAVYSSDCGGMTQSNEDAGFSKDPWPYLRSVVDGPARFDRCEEESASDKKPEDFCSASRYHTWIKTYTAEELGKVVSRMVKIGKPRSMEFTEYDSSGRVKTILLKDDFGKTATVRGVDFRKMLGVDVIKSTRMTVTVNPKGEFVIEGRGYGHGVGLCAFGANGLAKSRPDFTYVDILKFYYTDIDVKRAY